MKLRTAAFSCLVALAGALIYAQYPEGLSGHPRIVDGDTIAFGSQRVRLFGMDAPESEQTCTDDNGVRWFCGEVAKSALSAEVGGNRVSCDQKDVDRYGRIVAICTVDGRDIGGAMVLNGWAVDYPRFSNGLYAEEERIAKENRRGIWRGTFQRPEYWRREHRERRFPQ